MIIACMQWLLSSSAVDFHSWRWPHVFLCLAAVIYFSVTTDPEGVHVGIPLSYSWSRGSEATYGVHVLYNSASTPARSRGATGKVVRR